MTYCLGKLQPDVSVWLFCGNSFYYNSFFGIWLEMEEPERWKTNYLKLLITKSTSIEIKVYMQVKQTLENMKVLSCFQIES